MTDTALAATLFGAEDLRLVEAPLGALTPGMVRVRFGAGGICGSDMHYYRHGRTGDFVVKSPLVLGHEIAGEIVDMAADGGISRSATASQSTHHGGADTARDARKAVRTYARTSISWDQHQRRRTCRVALPHILTPSRPSVSKSRTSTPMAAAALAEPLAVCLHAISRAGRAWGGGKQSCLAQVLSVS